MTMQAVRSLCKLAAAERKRIRRTADREGNRALAVIHPFYIMDQELLLAMAAHVLQMLGFNHDPLEVLKSAEAARGGCLFPGYVPALEEMINSWSGSLGVLFESEEKLHDTCERLNRLQRRKKKLNWLWVPVSRHSGVPLAGFAAIARTLNECGAFHFDVGGAFLGSEETGSGCVGALVHGLIGTMGYFESDFHLSSKAVLRTTDFSLA